MLSTLVLVAGCGFGGDDSDADAERAAETAPRAAAPAPVPSGFTAASGAAWSFAYPSGWKAIPAKRTGDEELLGFQSPDGTDGLPSQVGIGVNPKPTNPLAAFVRVSREQNEIRYPSYRVRSDRAVSIGGAKGRRIDAEYVSFTESRAPVRTIELLVETAGGVQIDFFVRGPAADFDRLRLPAVVDTFRPR